MASFSLKVLLVSTGVLFIALLLKLSAPLVLYFFVHQAPLIWSTFVSWLKPPYLFVVVNCIIITIAASSRFQYRKHDEDQQEQVPVPKISTDSMREPDQFDFHEMKISTAEIRFGSVESTPEVVVYGQREGKDSIVFEDESTITEVVNNGSVKVEGEDEDEFVISKSTWMPPKRMDSSENLLEILSPAEKPLVSARFSHRKPLKACPEGGRALKVSKPKRHETLENTWKTITDGRGMPLTRHLKKLDTWENHGRHVNVSEVDAFPMKKSETFKERTNYELPRVSSSPASGKLRKEPSLSQDELNRRVEAFIKDFNEQMRLQRQESLNQYKEMISC